jgi:hypothetical protein
MTCHFCGRCINQAELNYHHLIPRSQGGEVTVPTHKSCHITHHSTSGHFRHWGRVGGQISALSRQWAFTLKNVRDNPAYEMDRQFYLLYYAQA